jgi:hypothetical protein
MSSRVGVLAGRAGLATAYQRAAERRALARVGQSRNWQGTAQPASSSGQVSPTLYPRKGSRANNNNNNNK